MDSHQIYDLLSDRAARHGLELHEVLDMTPSFIRDDPRALELFWEDKHLSHIYPQSLYPDLADEATNIIPEDADANMARSDDIMTSDEQLAAHADNLIDAFSAAVRSAMEEAFSFA